MLKLHTVRWFGLDAEAR